VPYDQKLYTWWSYRAPDWEKADKGRRLDHIWSTPDIAAHATHAEVIKPARGWTSRPSDHVPVIVSLDLPGIAPPAVTIAPAAAPAFSLS
jgi:exodeoxyribonuclease-3